MAVKILETCWMIIEEDDETEQPRGWRWIPGQYLEACMQHYLSDVVTIFFA